MKTSSLLWSWLQVLNKERYEALMQVYGDLGEAQKHLGEELLEGLGCRRDTIMKILMRMENFNDAAYIARLEQTGVGLLELYDDDYPSALKQVGDPPPFLYYKGDLNLLKQPCIGVVGTRRMTPYGRRVVQNFVPDFVDAGMVTVSGLALGIDAEVAKETLKAGGKTVAVLGHGLGMVYPESNQDLADDILKKGGLFLSEFPLDLPPDTYTFPARNRIIAGVSLGTVVIEAPAESGAIITAELALDYSRDVFAVPGQIFDPNSEGTNRLIAKGQAKLTTSAAEVLREVGVVAPEKKESAYEAASPEEAKLLAVLTTMPQASDDLVQKSGLPAGSVNALLTMMELSGGVKNVGGGMWVRA
jgi:DNA processing protein